MAEAIAVGASEKAMLSQEELESLFTDAESDRVERKREISGSAADRIKEAICAFANDYAGHGKPGVIFIGQNDDGSCAGTTIDDRLLTTLGGWRSDGNILPLPAMSIRRVTIGECAVAAIIVEPADSPPVRYDGRVWIRVGPRRALASPQEEQRLIERRRWGSLPFDQHPVRGASIDDIDLVRFNLEYLPSLVSRDTIAQNGRSDAQKLRSLRLVRPDLTPTVAGILLLGKDTQNWFPGAVVAWRRVDGTKIVDQTLDARTITGTVLDQVRRVDEVVEAVNSSALIMKPGAHERRQIYPPVALQQIVRNALMHRNYEGTNSPVRVTWFDDRVEVLSPGGPYGAVTPSNFGQPGLTDYRNPVVAEAFRAYHFVEKFGMGLEIVRVSLERNGNPPLEIQAIDTFVNATIRAAP